MSWNYRVVVRAVSGGPHNPEPMNDYGISEVYYDDGGQPEGYSSSSIVLGGWEDFEDLEGTYSLIAGAFKKPKLYEHTREDGSTFLSEQSF